LGITTQAHAAGTITRLSSGSATDQQNQPAISGTNVVWTQSQIPAGGGANNFEIYFVDLNNPAAPLNLTNTPGDQEFLEDIDGANVVWTHTSAGIPGDIVVYNLSSNTEAIVASSSNAVHFAEPAIRGQWITFLKISSNQTDVYLYDNLNGTPVGNVTTDAWDQAHPRVGGGVVVFEDYGSGNSDIMGWTIPSGPSFSIATGPNNQVTPDVDGNTVVWVESSASGDQIFAYDLAAGVSRQLTSSTSNKVLPRISGSRIIWSDNRNGNLDLYFYDLTTNQEQPLVTGVGDQFLSDIDGDRVVYTDNSAGFEQVYLYTFSVAQPPPPPLVANAGSDRTIQYSATRPTVTLDGCSSTGGNPNPPGALSYHWEQVGGTSQVTLSDANVCNPTFVAPNLSVVSSDVLTFQLTVSDGHLQSQAVVNITTVNTNRPPECHASAPAAVIGGTPAVALNGSASFDPDGDSIAWHWVQTSGPVSLSLTTPDAPFAYFDAPVVSTSGAFTFALTVDDGQLTSTCTLSVTVDTVNHCPQPSAGASRTVYEGAQVTLDGTATRDSDGDSLLYAWSQVSGPTVTLTGANGPTPTFQAPLVGPAEADLGFLLTVDDQHGCVQTASVTIHVSDVGNAPGCAGASASPATLWPPNHNLVPVQVMGVLGNGLPTTIAVTGIAQDEPVSDGQSGGGRDGVIQGSSALIRAERLGSGDGRVYHLRFTATNAQGSCTGDVTVCVPHEGGLQGTCIDSAANYPSTAAP
jgi:beta propeller repeat protein